MLLHRLGHRFELEVQQKILHLGEILNDVIFRTLKNIGLVSFIILNNSHLKVLDDEQSKTNNRNFNLTHERHQFALQLRLEAGDHQFDGVSYFTYSLVFGALHTFNVTFL